MHRPRPPLRRNARLPSSPQMLIATTPANCSNSSTLSSLGRATYAIAKNSAHPRACSNTNIGFTRTIVALPGKHRAASHPVMGDLHRHTAPGGSEA